MQWQNEPKITHTQPKIVSQWCTRTFWPWSDSRWCLSVYALVFLKFVVQLPNSDSVIGQMLDIHHQPQGDPTDPTTGKNVSRSTGCSTTREWSLLDRLKERFCRTPQRCMVVCMIMNYHGVHRASFNMVR